MKIGLLFLLTGFLLGLAAPATEVTHQQLKGKNVKGHCQTIWITYPMGEAGRSDVLRTVMNPFIRFVLFC